MPDQPKRAYNSQYDRKLIVSSTDAVQRSRLNLAETELQKDPHRLVLNSGSAGHVVADTQSSGRTSSLASPSSRPAKIHSLPARVGLHPPAGRPATQRAVRAHQVSPGGGQEPTGAG